MAARYATDTDLVGDPPGSAGAVAKDLSTVDPADRALWLEITRSMLNPKAWGKLLSHGHALLTAHHIAVALEEGAGAEPGPITGMSLGGASVSYATPSGDPPEQDLRATKYGRLYLALKAKIRGRLTPVALSTTIDQ